MKKIYALVAAAAATLSMNAQMYVCGNGEGLGWEPSAPLEVALENGAYTVTINNLVDFKISSTKSDVAGDWSGYNGGAYYATIGRTEIGQAVALEANTDAPNISVPYKGDWTIVVPADFSTITMTTTTEDPGVKAPDVYVRGGMNGWAASAEWQFVLGTETEETYTYYFDAQGATEIPAAEEFKIGDADWGSVNYGAGGEIEVGEELVWNHNDNNGTLAAPYTGTIEFVLNKITPKDPAIVTFHTSIIEHPIAGIANVAVDNSNAPVEYFNFQGVRVANPENGIYIRRQGTEATKIFVK